MELHGLCLRSFVYHVLAGWLWARPLATVTLGLLPCAVGREECTRMPWESRCRVQSTARTDSESAFCFCLLPALFFVGGSFSVGLFAFWLHLQYAEVPWAWYQTCASTVTPSHSSDNTRSLTH